MLHGAARGDKRASTRRPPLSARDAGGARGKGPGERSGGADPSHGGVFALRAGAWRAAAFFRGRAAPEKGTWEEKNGCFCFACIRGRDTL